LKIVTRFLFLSRIVELLSPSGQPYIESFYPLYRDARNLTPQ